MCLPPQFFHPVNERELLPADCQSQQEYLVSESEDTDTIFSVTTRYWEDTMIVARLDPQPTDFVRQSLPSPFPRPSKTNLGFLNFPIEILHDIVRQLDIKSILALRKTNQRAREVIASLPEYRRVMTYALDAVLALCCTEIAPYVGLTALYDVLCNNACSVCGGFGPYMFMPTLDRCCSRCLQYSSKFEVAPLTGPQRKALHRYESPSFRIVRSLPGVYLRNEKPMLKRYRLVAASTVPKVVTLEKTEGDRHLKHYAFRYMSAIAMPPLDISGKEPQLQKGMSCRGCKLALSKSNGEAAIRVGGFLMPPCGTRLSGLRVRRYSRRGFMEHFLWCAWAQELWRLSEGGTVSVEEKETWEIYPGVQALNSNDSFAG